MMTSRSAADVTESKFAIGGKREGIRRKVGAAMAAAGRDMWSGSRDDDVIVGVGCRVLTVRVGCRESTAAKSVEVAADEHDAILRSVDQQSHRRLSAKGRRIVRATQPLQSLMVGAEQDRQ